MEESFYILMNAQKYTGNLQDIVEWNIMTRL